jgi:tetratricopeptide (TPR) repeat protein
MKKSPKSKRCCGRTRRFSGALPPWRALFQQGRLDDALVEVKKSIEMAEGLRAEMNRSLAMYYSNLGTIYATKNMTDEAQAEFKHALESSRMMSSRSSI